MSKAGRPDGDPRTDSSSAREVALVPDEVSLEFVEVVVWEHVPPVVSVQAWLALERLADRNAALLFQDVFPTLRQMHGNSWRRGYHAVLPFAIGAACCATDGVDFGSGGTGGRFEDVDKVEDGEMSVAAGLEGGEVEDVDLDANESACRDILKSGLQRAGGGAAVGGRPSQVSAGADVVRGGG